MSVSEAYEPIDLRDIDTYPQFYFGGFWRRFSAFFIDGILLATPFILAAQYQFGDLSALNPEFQQDAFWLQVGFFIVSAFYFIVLNFLYGATPGKKVSRLRIVKMDKSRISLKDSFLRYLPLLLLSAACLLATAFFAPEVITEGNPANTAVDWLFTAWIIGSGIYLARQRQRRAPHDLLAGTAVIKV